MKRKLLNAALFGAVLVAAPVSTFVSCADYDSDITALENEVSSLKDLVNQKEAAIKTSIAALEAQDKLLAEKDAALDKAVADCKTHCANEIAKCKSDCAAARAQLQAAIDELKASLAAAEKKHGEDVLALLQADKELQNGIDAAKAYAEGVQANLDKLAGEVETLAEGLVNTQTDVQNLVEGLKDLKGEVADVKASVKKVADDLEGLKKYVDEKVDELKTLVNNTETALKGQIAGNTTLITTLSKTVEDNKAEFNTFKTKAEGEIAALQSKDAELAGSIKDAVERVAALEEGLSVTQKDVMDLSDGLHELQTQVNLLSADVAKNTKALVDLAVRMVDAEVAIAEAVKNLGVLQSQYDAFVVAQKGVDEAQDAALVAAVAALTKAEGEYSFDNINKAYKAALEYALQAAQTAQANAETFTKGYAYDKAKVDEFVRTLEAADAQRDADFQAWQEQVLLPLFADVWGELLDEDGNSRLSVLEEGLKTTQEDVMNLGLGLREVTTLANENQIKIAEVEEAYKAADAKIEADFRAWIELELNPAFEAVYAAIAELGLDLSKEVKGFVLEPASYYEGIQAIEGVSYEYHKWNVTDELNPVQDGDLVKYCPTVTAHYHVNPSAAVLSKDVANYSYAVLDRQNRGVNTGLNPVIKGVAQNGGMLDVTLSLDANANKTPVGHDHPGEVTVMALQYKNPAAKAADQVVTSDYAVLYLNPLKEVSLVDANETATEIADAAEFATVGYVEYTAECYDIQEQLKTSFGGEMALSISDNKWPEGFTYRYTPVAGDVTYFAAITADGKVKPQLPNGKDATTACVGKSATWRVDVMRGDDVVEVGFYKVVITGEAVVETANAVVTDEEYIIECESVHHHGVPALTTSLSIDNVWNKVAEVTGEELDVVKGKYAVSLTTDGRTQRLVQFTQYESEDGRTLYKQYAGIGDVTLLNDNTVKWIVEYDDPALAAFFTLTKETKAITTWVRVRSLDAISKDTYNEFYLPITWAPKHIENWGDYQEVSWNYTRVGNQWQDNKGTREEAELRLYADLTKTGTTPFTYNIAEKAMVDFKYNGDFEWQEPAKSFVHIADGDIKLENGHFIFIQHPNEAARMYDVVDADGITSTYELAVNEEGNKLQAVAGKAIIADVATITPEGVITLENNRTTQLLLNAHEKDELLYGQSLCVRVGYAIECCAGPVKVKDGDFDVRFIKPLTVTAEDINISDADDAEFAGKITASVLDNIVAFNGYTLAQRPNYITVFGVGIDLGDVADWKTNYNAEADNFEKTLADNNIDELFSTNEAKGEITYTNNTAVVSEFSVIVPVKVSYIWYLDPISVDIKLNVGRTQGNSHRR